MVSGTEKISITVNVPALGNIYNFIVPDSMSIQNAQHLMIRILSSEYGISERSDTNDGTALRLECSFAQLGISDGAKLLLM